MNEKNEKKENEIHEINEILEQIHLFYSQWNQILHLYESWARDHHTSYNVILTMQTMMQHPEGCTSKRICDKHGFPKQTISTMIKELTAKGWIEMKPDPGDKRAKLLYLTPAGRSYIQSLSQQLTSQDIQIFETMGEEKLLTLTNILEEYITLCKEEIKEKNENPASEQ